MQRGACREVDPELFYPGPYSGRPYKRAKAICGTCPVRQRCLDFALAHMSKSRTDDPADAPIGQHGCWGGTSPEEREAMLRPALAMSA